MSNINFPIEKINNRFFKDNIFKVQTQPTTDEDYTIQTNVKVELTGVKNYIKKPYITDTLFVGDKQSYITYTIHLLPTNKESDAWNSSFAKMYGREVGIRLRVGPYYELREIMNKKISNYLKVFSIDREAICTKVINEMSDPAQIEKSDPPIFFESLVREWFKKNPHKHTLKSGEKERVIQKILKNK